jgi:hypothetical protein
LVVKTFVTGWNRTLAGGTNSHRVLKSVFELQSIECAGYSLEINRDPPADPWNTDPDTWTRPHESHGVVMGPDEVYVSFTNNYTVAVIYRIHFWASGTPM